MQINTKMVESVEERNEFFDTHWPTAMIHFVGMTLREKEWTASEAKDLVKGLGHLMCIINDMREVDKQQQAEIASLKACMNLKEQ